MKRLLVAPSAQKDLQGIHDFIAQDNPEAADRWIDKLVSRFDNLSHQPGIGRKRDDLKSGYRSISEGQYVIFYRIATDDALEIVRVLHGKRDLRKALDN